VGPFDGLFAKCIMWHSAKVVPLPSTMVMTLGKEALSVPRCTFFVECCGRGTRQSTSLPSVTLDKVTRISLFYLFLLFHTKKQRYIT
jgi:hypothetical protein